METWAFPIGFLCTGRATSREESFFGQLVIKREIMYGIRMQTYFDV